MTDTVENRQIPSCGYSPKEANEIAKEIITQLGGSRALNLMVGAYNLSSHHDEGRGALSFRFRGSRKANHVKIILTAMDDYYLRFQLVGRHSTKVVATREDVYCDNLREVFERVTGCTLYVPYFVDRIIP